MAYTKPLFPVLTAWLFAITTSVLTATTAPALAQTFSPIFNQNDRFFATNCLNTIVRGGIEIKGQQILGERYNCSPLSGGRLSDGSFAFEGTISHQLDWRPDDHLHFRFRLEPDLTFVPYVLTETPNGNGVSSATMSLTWESGGFFAFPSAILNRLQDAFRFSTPFAGPDLDHEVFAPQYEEWDDWEFVTGWLAYQAIEMKIVQLRAETPAGPATPPPDRAGPRLPIYNALGRCLDVDGGISANNRNVQIFQCNGTAAQQWSMYPNGEIRNAVGRCLDVAGGVNANRTNVQLFDCNGTAAQQWSIDSNGEIRNAIGRCLEVAGGVNANRTNVQIFDCNGTLSQVWGIGERP